MPRFGSDSLAAVRPRATLSMAWSRLSESVCRYRSVVAMLVWPRSAWTSRSEAPLCSAWVAKVWRRMWTPRLRPSSSWSSRSHARSGCELRIGSPFLDRITTSPLTVGKNATESVGANHTVTVDGEAFSMETPKIQMLGYKRTLDLPTFLRALGLPELGKNVSKILNEKYKTLEAARKVTAEEFAQVHGIGDVIARTVVEGLKDASDLIDALLKHVKIEEGAAAGGAGAVDGGAESLQDLRRIAAVHCEALDAVALGALEEIG